jgi:leader peptidase (prepilin peptidase)/N-methyltransferase
MLNVLYAIIGLLAGGLINVLADDLPARVRPRRPHCPNCGHIYGPAGWLAIGRRLQGGACPECALATRRRALLVEIGTALLFVLLPWLITPTLDLAIYSVYIAILLAASYLLTDMTIRLSLVGGFLGFVLFFLVYLLGQRLFGPGALGFGDVTLAATLGFMLGFQYIFFALVLGVLLAGLWSLLGLLTGRVSRRTHFAYGPFLAVAGIVMIIWGDQIYAWVTNS